MIFKVHRKRWIYYSLGFLALVPIFIVYYFFPQLFIDLFSFFLGFFWIYSIDTPGVAERIRRRRYRLSFLRIIYKLDQWVVIKVNRFHVHWGIGAAMRTLVPTLFVAILYSLTYVLPPYWTLLGAFYYLIWNFFVWRKIRNIL